MLQVPIWISTLAAATWTVITISVQMAGASSLPDKVNLAGFAFLGMAVIMLIGLGIQWLIEDIIIRTKTGRR